MRFLILWWVTYKIAEVEGATAMKDAETDPLPEYFEIEISFELACTI
jgi:hypothetical protein